MGCGVWRSRFAPGPIWDPLPPPTNETPGQPWIVHRVVDGEDRYTASTSVDGRHFVQGGTWTAALGDAPRIGLISLGGTGFTSTFDDLRVSTVVSSRR